MRNYILMIFFSFLLLKNLLPQEYGGWITADSMEVTRPGFSTVILSSGNILATGGDIDSLLRSAEIYDVAGDEWRSTTPMNSARTNHHLVLLKSGKVLAIGGLNNRSCEIYDPQTETWEFTDSLNINRNYGMTSTVLKDGRVLVTGGSDYNPDGSQIIRDDCEIYDPENKIWESVTPMQYERRNHKAVLLNDHNVLVIGGSGAASQTEVYDVTENKWLSTDTLNTGRSGFSLTKIFDGRVLVFGGADNSVEIYDPATGQWTMGGSMANPRSNHHSFLLDSGLILIFGGSVLKWELYDPESLQSIYSADFPAKKMDQDAKLLPDGRVISMGGMSWEGMAIFAVTTCEIYDPNLTNMSKKRSIIPSGYYLRQNYPNPFNPSTQISFGLPEDSPVNISIYNVTGEKIATLVDQHLTKGYHQVTWNGTNQAGQPVSAGIYIYRMTTGDQTFVKKMFMAK